MNLRRITLGLISIVVGAVLIELLIRLSGVKWDDVLAHFLDLDWLAFVRLAALMAASMYLSSRKWQVVDHALRRPADRPVSEPTSFALTSIGAALGQVVPVQIAASLARTLGVCAYGSAMRRGTLSTLVEQGSDLVIVFFLALASAATIVLHGHAWMWLGFAFAIWSAAMLGVPHLLPLTRKLASSFTAKGAAGGGWRKAIAELGESRLLSAKLARQLMTLSSLRFVVLVLMAGQTSAAIRCGLPLWRLAASMPIVVLSSAIGITPGGLGFTEFGYSAMLSAYGTPLATATQWAIANRLLTSAAAFMIGLITVLIFVGTKTMHAHRSEMVRPACE